MTTATKIETNTMLPLMADLHSMWLRGLSYQGHTHKCCVATAGSRLHTCSPGANCHAQSVMVIAWVPVPGSAEEGAHIRAVVEYQNGDVGQVNVERLRMTGGQS